MELDAPTFVRGVLTDTTKPSLNDHLAREPETHA